MKVDWGGIEKELKSAHKIMREYQRSNVSAAFKSKRHIFSAKMGTGKTLMSLTSTILQRPERILVICSKNALWTWKKELRKWYPSLADQKGIYQIMRGTPIRRKKLWAGDNLFKICTYGTLLRDIDYALAWDADVIIADEYHRGGWKNHKAYQKKIGQKAQGAKGVTAARKLVRACRSVFMMSGSATRKGPLDYWGPLHLCDPRLFSSYWQFVYTYHNVIDGIFGKEILGPRNIEGFKIATKPYLTHISKKVIDEALPPITRVIINIEMSQEQKQYYIDMDEKMFALDIAGNLAVASTTLTKMIRLRQVLCCPKILGLNSCGAGIESIVDKIQDLENTHVVVFVPFTAAIPHIKEYLEQKLKVEVMTLQGGADMEEVQEKTHKFNESTTILMLCSLLYAQSFELDSSDYCFFLGYDYDQMNNQQAEGRLRRMTRAHRPLMAFYIKHISPKGMNEETVDDRILEILNTNTRYVNITHDEYEAPNGNEKKIREKAKIKT